jgi:hypothetical protein
MYENVYDFDGNNAHQSITSKELLGLACAADDVDMVNTISYKFEMKLGRNELDIAVIDGSIRVIDFLCLSKNLKISRNCVSHLIVWKNEDYKWHVLDYILQKGYIKLSKTIVYNLVDCVKFYAYDAQYVNYILNQYSTQKMLNRALVEYVYALQLPAIEDLMLRSNRVHIQPRLFRIIDNWDQFKLPRLELILYNRFVINQRRQIA